MMFITQSKNYQECLKAITKKQQKQGQRTSNQAIRKKQTIEIDPDEKSQLKNRIYQRVPNRKWNQRIP